MDKWDEMMQSFYGAVNERNDEKLIRVAFVDHNDEKLIRVVVGFALELARTVERIADALEKK